MTGAPVALFFGTRPQVIKASVLREALSQVGQVLAVDSGQHYDYTMHRVHYDQLGVEPPDAFLGVGAGSHAEQTAEMLTACEQWLTAHPVRLAVVIGDTNTTLACALAAAKHRIPVAHVEAGLRAADTLMAEEINRRVVDALAHWLCAPCQRVATVLRQEHPAAVVEDTGDVAYDVLRRSVPLVPSVQAIPGLAWAGERPFVYCTLHRAELVGSPEQLRAVLDALARVSFPVLFAAHPRTTAAMERLGVTLGSNVRRLHPVGYLESLALLQRATVVVTDSGGLQREAYWLGRPCVTVRGETEWVETVEYGANRLVPPDLASQLPEAVAAASATPGDWNVGAYGNGDAATRVASMLAHD